jgi:hypothetical protein
MNDDKLGHVSNYLAYRKNFKKLYGKKPDNTHGTKSLQNVISLSLEHISLCSGLKARDLVYVKSNFN